ncbi:MAG: alpha-L-rhamnosidase N-terminal domain-containing protein, partial [Bacteroidales bacterium]
MKKILFLLFIISFVINSCDLKEKSLKITSLKTEYTENPIGIDVPSPRFTWILEDTMRNVKQTAYRILVASDPSLLKPGKADLWNSGWVESDQSVFVNYQGEDLESGKRYYWTVSVKDNYEREVKPSKDAYFEMGFLDPSDWQAEWIGFRPREVAENAVPKDMKRPRSVLLRKEFQLPKNIKSARLYASGLGNYVFYINGEKVGNDLLTPGWTDYNKRVQYQVYDITEMLEKGENAAGIMLGNMWWSGGLGWAGEQVYSNGPLRAIAQIAVEYKNGEKEIIQTDDSWKGNLSPVVDNSLYHGETWDARLEIPFWAESGLEDSRWFPVEIIPMDTIM